MAALFGGLTAWLAANIVDTEFPADLVGFLVSLTDCDGQELLLRNRLGVLWR